MVDKKQIISAAIIGTLVGATGLALISPDLITKEIPIDVIKQIEVIKEVPTIVTQIKEVPVNVTVEKTIYVDNGHLDLVKEYLDENVDEDLTVEYMIFEVDARIEGEAYIRDNIKSILDDEDFFDDGELLSDYRKSEVSVKKVYDPEVMDKDYDDLDVELEYEVKIRAKEDGEDREYFDFKVTVPFEGGKLVDEDIDIEEL